MFRSVLIAFLVVHLANCMIRRWGNETIQMKVISQQPKKDMDQDREPLLSPVQQGVRATPRKSDATPGKLPETSFSRQGMRAAAVKPPPPPTPEKSGATPGKLPVTSFSHQDARATPGKLPETSFSRQGMRAASVKPPPPPTPEKPGATPGKLPATTLYQGVRATPGKLPVGSYSYQSMRAATVKPRPTTENPDAIAPVGSGKQHRTTQTSNQTSSCCADCCNGFNIFCMRCGTTCADCMEPWI